MNLNLNAMLTQLIETADRTAHGTLSSEDYRVINNALSFLGDTASSQPKTSSVFGFQKPAISISAFTPIEESESQSA